jgi:uncharacterized protein YfdQ (DUF2303 family)
MKKVIYRLQFRFEETNKTEMRDNKLNSILSSMEDIDTESPIQSPSNGTIIEIDGKDYEVKSKKISFVTEGDVVFYTTIVILASEVKKKDYDEQLESIRKLMQGYGSDKKKSKWDNYDDLFGLH